MSRMPVFLILVFFIGVVPSASGFGAQTAPQALLRDGFVLSGVDGKLIGPDSNDGWFFELASDVNDYGTIVEAGTRLELLSSSALEKMTADVVMRSAATYRLWDGRVTKYKGRNFIFPNYFLPLSKTKEPQSQASQQPLRADSGQRIADRKKLNAERYTLNAKCQPAVEGPNDILAMPQEIKEKLKARRIVRPEKVSRSAKATGGAKDSVLAGRTALLVEQDDGELVFVLDAFGRNVQQVSLRLLPCEALELTEGGQFAVPEPVWFKIAGIITKYKGRDYLLLHQATRVYSHGNFRTPILQ